MGRKSLESSNISGVTRYGCMHAPVEYDGAVELTCACFTRVMRANSSKVSTKLYMHRLSLLPFIGKNTFLCLALKFVIVRIFS